MRREAGVSASRATCCRPVARATKRIAREKIQSEVKMLGLLVFLTLQVASVQIPTDQEIVVTGKRMSQTQYAMKVHRKTKATQCWITRSSGDPRIDWQVCEIAKTCAGVVPLKRKVVEACMRERKAEFLRTYRPG
jgi:hypothetical protein